jgi:hypothetical protein
MLLTPSQDVLKLRCPVGTLWGVRPAKVSECHEALRRNGGSDQRLLRLVSCPGQGESRLDGTVRRCHSGSGVLDKKESCCPCL